ncbi:Epidermal retinol dehydrogenase 2 [Cyphellophora attinorum]|uniref:Epidermal retinol dehydrogenase 2 n=1 Tax=Cyphellophora attinorum TaxID=1664694 RepID=A0A0N0NP43_9EURO|nr:Epidermal retinol dehydrogenase 2 [Phialophora attinorum]KPI42288.1 Epidermal retinol dehydrogenase 2 [Phialophora attinorum]
MSRLLLEPAATGALLYLLTRNPSNLRDQFSSTTGINETTLRNLIIPLKWLFSLGLLRRFHNAMTTLAFNNWQFRPQGEPWKFGDDKLSELVLITGGCSGFGRLMAKDFSKHARVVILDIQEPPEDLRVPNIHFYRCDVSDPGAIQSTAVMIREQHGTVSVLINNAGIARGLTLLESSIEYTEKIFKVNTFAHIYLIKEFLPAMLEARKGHVVSICSIASYITLPPILHYCATKTASNYISDGLRSELLTRYPNGNTILTTSVHPTFHDTPMLGDIFGKSSRTSTDMIYPPENVSRKVVEQVLQARSGKLFIPENEYYLSFWKFAPTWLVDLLIFARNKKRLKMLAKAASQ